MEILKKKSHPRMKQNHKGRSLRSSEGRKAGGPPNGMKTRVTVGRSCDNAGRDGEDTVNTLLSRISITPGLRSGEPCIRGLRITVWDTLRWLGTGASHAQIISDYPELTEEDILAALQWAAALKDQQAIR